MGDIYYEWITGKKEERMKDYREKTVRGFIGDNTKGIIPKPCQVTVRMTKDKRGATLSLQGFNVLIGIPLEAVADIVKVVEE